MKVVGVAVERTESRYLRSAAHYDVAAPLRSRPDPFPQALHALRHVSIM